MSRLICYHTDIFDYKDHPLVEVGYREYIIKRCQFWRWRLHRTMGRSVLILRRNYRI